MPLRSEIELAYRWEQERRGGPRPILAITGTDGKTTTTELTVAILRAAGLGRRQLGNTESPLVDALDSELDAFVVECTSFRLAWTERFRADAAVWLNLAPDHLNWHASMTRYEAAKARIFELQQPSDVAIGFVACPRREVFLCCSPAFGLVEYSRLTPDVRDKLLKIIDLVKPRFDWVLLDTGAGISNMVPVRHFAGRTSAGGGHARTDVDDRRLCHDQGAGHPARAAQHRSGGEPAPPATRRC